MVSMLARAVQKNGRRSTLPLAWSKLNSNSANRVSKQTHSLNSATKKNFDHFSIGHRQASCDHLPFKSAPTRFFCPHHYYNPRRPPQGSPFFSLMSFETSFGLFARRHHVLHCSDVKLCQPARRGDLAHTGVSPSIKRR